MKFTITSLIAIAAFTSTTLANPITQIATVTLANEYSGANAGAQVPADGVQRSFTSLYGSSNLNNNGVIKASSIALNGVAPAGLRPGGTTCTIYNGSGQPLVILGSQQTYYRFGSDPTKLEIVDVTYDSITCS